MGQEHDWQKFKIGEFLPGQWERIRRFLGRSGIGLEPETQAGMEVIAGQKDFLDFAARHEISESFAMRAYMELVRRFEYKLMPEPTKGYWRTRGLTPERIQNFPVKFRSYPPPEGRLWTDAERDLVRDMEIDSLAEYVRMIDESIEIYGPEIGVTIVTGKGIGPRISDFWREFLKDKLGADPSANLGPVE